MGGNPKDSGLGEISGLLQAMIESDPRLPESMTHGGMRIDPSGVPNLGGLNALTNQYYDASAQNINRNVAGAGQLGAARGYSMGLSNPFAMAQRAENSARGAMGGLEAARAGQMMQNPLTANALNLQTKQFNNQLLLQLLGMKTGVIGGREGNVAADTMGAAFGGLGQIGAAFLA